MLFDVDGTLVDHDGALREGLIGWLIDKKLATEEQCLDGLVGLWDGIAERHFPAFRAREITFHEQRRRRLRDFLPHLGLRVDRFSEAALDHTFQDYYLEHYEAAWRAFHDVAPCLTSLRHVRLVVLTNGDQAQQEDKLRRTHLDQYFEVVFASSSLNAAKPYPEAFTLACERLAVDPARVTYVGDRLDIDAQAATAAGLRGVWLDRRALRPEEHKPTITSLTDLPGVLG